MLTARYRRDYDGEFVVTETRWAGGKKTQKREWVANPIVNQHISGRAACIASDCDRVGTDQNSFDYTRLQNHRGGLLGSKKLQTYGVGSITREMRLDFAIDSQQSVLDEIMSRGYQVNNVVYTTPKLCVYNPGEFYLIPYNPLLALEALPLYLACFDGHSEIFMLGYNKDTPGGNAVWSDHVDMVIRAYPAVTFWMIGVESNMFDSWRLCANTKSMTYREFISYCDVSQ